MRSPRKCTDRELGGQVTVFFSLIMMCLFALFCVLTESARTAGARWYLQMAANSALDSVFSQYHRQLWDSYRLLFAEYKDQDALVDDFKGFVQPYLEAENWYPTEYESAEIEELLYATDDNGTYFEQEVLDYMRYGIWKLNFDADTVSDLQKYGQEAQAISAVAESYRGHAKEALKLEKSLEAISENLEEQHEKKQQGLSCLRAYDGDGFCRQARELIRKLEKIPGLVGTYRRRADALARGLEESREICGPSRDACTDPVDQMLEEEIQEYESYVAQDGARRQEVERLEELSAEQILFIEDIIEEAEEVERMIEEWEDSEEEDEDGEEPDLDALWSPVIRRFSGLDISALSFAHGVKDKEKEGLLNQVEQMYRSGLLSILIPEDAVVSQRYTDLQDVPSTAEIMTEGARGIAAMEHLLVNEYCGEFFSCFCSAETGNSSVLQYEMEYLLGGRMSDEENLSAAVQRLLVIREGLNLVHILSNPSKRAEARSLAMAITGLASATPLVLLTTFFVMSVWALGEAILDIRGLLAGKKVPLFKDTGDWNLSIEQLLSLGKDDGRMTGGGERGLSYLSWLKILLFLDDIVLQEYRMMDVMQINLNQQQKSFRMRNGVYEVKLKGRFCGKHVFFSLGFVENLLGDGGHRYVTEVSAERVY